MTTTPKESSTKQCCVYCLKPTDRLAADNIFGQTWQGETTGDKLDRWQAPACLECTNKFDRIEHDFLVRIGQLFAPIEISLLGIPAEVEDFIKAKTEEIRKGVTEKSTQDEILFRQIVRGASIDLKLVEKVKKQDKYTPILDIKRLTAKFVRGLLYSLHNCCIDKDHKLEIFFTHELNPDPICEAIEAVGSEIFCGKGVKIRASFAEDDPQSGIFEIKIWENLKLFAFSK